MTFHPQTTRPNRRQTPRPVSKTKNRPMTSPIPEDFKPANAVDDTAATPPDGQDSGSAERGARVPRPVRRTRPGEDGGKAAKGRGRRTSAGSRAPPARQARRAAPGPAAMTPTPCSPS